MRKHKHRQLVTSPTNAQPVKVEQPLQHNFSSCLTHYKEAKRKKIIKPAKGMKESENYRPKSVPAIMFIYLRTLITRLKLRKAFQIDPHLLNFNSLSLYLMQNLVLISYLHKLLRLPVMGSKNDRGILISYQLNSHQRFSLSKVSTPQKETNMLMMYFIC